MGMGRRFTRRYVDVGSRAKPKRLMSGKASLPRSFRVGVQPQRGAALVRIASERRCTLPGILVANEPKSRGPSERPQFGLGSCDVAGGPAPDRRQKGRQRHLQIDRACQPRAALDTKSPHCDGHNWLRDERL
jgi:hypothetical protein